MKQIVVAVIDRKMEQYMTLWCAQTQGAALRAFQDEVNNHENNNPLAKHPEDYGLYQIAEWDNATGEIIPTTPNKPIAQAIDVLTKGN